MHLIITETATNMEPEVIVLDQEDEKEKETSHITSVRKREHPSAPICKEEVKDVHPYNKKKTSKKPPSKLLSSLLPPLKRARLTITPVAKMETSVEVIEIDCSSDEEGPTKPKRMTSPTKKTKSKTMSDQEIEKDPLAMTEFGDIDLEHSRDRQKRRTDNEALAYSGNSAPVAPSPNDINDAKLGDESTLPNGPTNMNDGEMIEESLRNLQLTAQHWLTESEMGLLRAKMDRKVKSIEVNKNSRKELCSVINEAITNLSAIKDDEKSNNASSGCENTRSSNNRGRHWTILRSVVDAFALFITQKTTTTNANESSSSSSIISRERQKQIAVLERALKECREAIKKLEESEVDFNSDEWEETYLKESRYKRRCTKIYRRLLELKEERMSLSWQRDKKVRLKSSQYCAINEGLQLLVRRELKARREPDFNDVFSIVSKINQEHNLGLSSCQVQDEAKSNFRDIVSMVKKRSTSDFWANMNSYFDEDEDSHPQDPLEGNLEMQKRFRESENRRESQLEALMKKYSKAQNEVGVEELEGDEEVVEEKDEDDYSGDDCNESNENNHDSSGSEDENEDEQKKQ